MAGEAGHHGVERSYRRPVSWLIVAENGLVATGDRVVERR